MSTVSSPLRLAGVRPRNPARRALLALAVTLARLALHEPDPHAAVAREAARARHEQDFVRLLARSTPLR